jgi:hypothetical protein
MLNVVAIILFLVLFAVAAYFIYSLIKKYLDSSQQIRFATMQQERSQQTLHLRLQAYERLILLCERLFIPNLVARLRTEGASAQDLRMAMLIAIQQEFDHNATQQIYVSEQLWSILQVIKNNTADIINAAAQDLEGTADSGAYVQALFKFVDNQSKSIVLKAQTAIREEAQSLMK